MCDVHIIIIGAATTAAAAVAVAVAVVVVDFQTILKTTRAKVPIVVHNTICNVNRLELCSVFLLKIPFFL